MGTACVTGANRGIGLELCKQLKASGHQVIAVCRTPSAELQALGVRVEAGVDVSAAEGVASLAERLGATRIDLLINNAGILRRESLDEMSFESMVEQFEVNSLGPLRVTHALLTNLGEGSKVGLVTSRMGSIADNTSGSRYGYRMSKAALNIAGVSLAHDLRHRGIAVAILHPGFVRTEMTNQQGLIDADESARGLLARLEALTLETSGTFWHQNGDILPW
ncbi:MAG: short-chain dehydrogenase [Proteobacteria bacterium]|nr:MAG: short-chain dehydrogenase [Pseudomonadota bacterium]